VSTSAKPQKPDLGAAIKIRELLKEREAKQQEYQTRTYVDQPKTITTTTEVGDNNAVWLVTIVAMESGRVWRSTNGGPWFSVTHYPLPDTPSREDFDDLMALNRELAALGHEDED
jgi:hypothetical protein